jgi:flagellar motor protein MotB
MADKHEEHEGSRHRSHGPGGGHGGGGGSHEEHEGAPEWLISFADNVMLQMGFFVILLALNMKPAMLGAAGEEGTGKREQEDAMLDFAIAVRTGFNNPVDLGSTRAEDAPLIRRLVERQKAGEATDNGPDGDDQNVQSVRPSGYSSLGGKVSFVDNSAVISETERRRAAEVARKIAGQRWIVEVRGHVSAAESFREGSRGWKLSHERAMAVREVLVEAGVDERQIRIVACGDTDPLHRRAYEPGEQRTNQRVEIVVTDQLAPVDK